jgi:hypothetical protein
MLGIFAERSEDNENASEATMQQCHCEFTKENNGDDDKARPTELVGIFEELVVVLSEVRRGEYDNENENEKSYVLLLKCCS